MKRLLIIFCFVFLNSCSSSPEEMMPYLNGYWEIQEVIMPNGSEVVYDFNQMIDYISINENFKGFRKKLEPSFNNKYATSQDAEAITVKFENDSFNLYYNTPFSSWKETVIEVNESTLKVVNENNSTYIYKRYQGLELDLD